METKKTIKANLEKTKTTNLLMGAIVALAVLFVSFEWGTNEVNVFEAARGLIVEPPVAPITFPEPPPPPPPPPAKVEIAEVIKVVDDGAETPDTYLPGTEEPGDPLPLGPPTDVYKDDEVPDEKDFFIVVETMPKYPGGDAALMSYIAQSIKYPAMAIERGIEGSVVCSFIIDKDGSITDIEVLRGIDVSLDKEAVRVIGLMPKWSPGMQRDKAVRVKYTLPIRFRLQK
ncbi:MAG: TonB family protein [Tannerella sp.]|jgi:protein TonB|nr:TonB family protein [Tannerella sp.]